MPTLFTKIINGEVPSYKIAEDDKYIAFLDVFPNVKGHTLVVPKEEVDYIFDMEDTAYMGLMNFAKKIAPAIEKAVLCKRIGVSVLGLEVPHTHVHLIPLNNASDMDFTKPKMELSEDEMKKIAADIRSHL